MPNQEMWHFCQNCFEMFFDGAQNKGSCAATGGGHVSLGFNFALPFDVDQNQGQPNWRFCQNCFAAFFDGSPNKGRCPAGDALHGHVAQGFAFVLPHDRPEQGGEQKDWRFCQQCFAMFFDGSQDHGHCPAGGGHVAQGFNFVLPHTGFDVTSFISGPLTTDLPLGGSAGLRVAKNGAFTFQGHAHDSSTDDINYVLSAVLMTPSGEAFTFQHKGDLHGVSPGKRDDAFSCPGSNPKIAEHWAEIPGSVWTASIVGQDTFISDLEGILGDVIKQALAAAAEAAVKELVKVVTA